MIKESIGNCCQWVKGINEIGLLPAGNREALEVCHLLNYTHMRELKLMCLNFGAPKQLKISII